MVTFNETTIYTLPDKNRRYRMDILEYLMVAEQAARIGGEILQDWAERFTTREKSPANLVTEADFASEQAIFLHIRGHFPDHQFLGEEGLLEDQTGSLFRWIIDPLDGTSNYVHRFPYYAVSIGLEYDGKLIVGAIYDPTRDEMFAAGAGHGARLNGKPIHVSDTDQLSNAMCMASLPVKSTREHVAVRKFLEVLESAQTVQRSGSAALNLCSVAAGRIDAFFSSSLNPWDMAAGVVIVQEAGGTVTTEENQEFQIQNPNILATNGTPLHQQLVTCLSHVAEK